MSTKCFSALWKLYSNYCRRWQWQNKIIGLQLQSDNTNLGYDERCCHLLVKGVLLAIASLSLEQRGSCLPDAAQRSFYRTSFTLRLTWALPGQRWLQWFQLQLVNTKHWVIIWNSRSFVARAGMRWQKSDWLEGEEPTHHVKFFGEIVGSQWGGVLRRVTLYPKNKTWTLKTCVCMI